jgi:hypothetical protein
MASNESNEPPKLKINVDGAPDVASIADLLEWFLQRDQRVGMIRHPHVEELFQWKRRDDESHGQEKAPFDSAEARFAIGSIQALMENRDELSLQLWMTNLLQALGEAKETNEDLAKQYGLDTSNSHIEESQKLPTTTERRLFLTSSWLEALCTAEVRFLGWVYQELYGRPFQPLTDGPDSGAVS